MVKTMRVLPFLFSLVVMLVFLFGWFTAFPNAYSAPSSQTDTENGGVLFFVAAYVLTAAASSLVSFYYLLRFSRHRTPLGPKVFGISLGFANLLTVAVCFSLITFILESVRSGLLQWGGLYLYFGWILVYGLPFAMALGLIFGLVLNRVAYDHRHQPGASSAS